MNNLKLLFLHGAGGTKSKWRKLKDELDRTDIIYSIIDLPGHGEDPNEVPESMEEFAAQINEEINSNVIIIGHSMGGLIGIEIAARTENVKGLVLINSHFQLPVHPKVLEKLSSEALFPESFFKASYGQAVDPALLEEERKELYYNSKATIVKDFTNCANYKNGKSKVSQLNIPLLAIYGSEDLLIPKTAEEELLEVAKKLAIEKIDGAGHYLILEKSEELFSRILAFYETFS